MHMMERVKFIAWFHAKCFVDDLRWDAEQAISDFNAACAAGVIFS